MHSDFVLELREVSSLTEARFAAGEGFTHIRLSKALANGPEAAIIQIKDFLSGVAVGMESSIEQTMPEWVDYYAVQNRLWQEGKETHIVVLDSLESALPDTLAQENGISLPGINEYKTGFADYEPHQILLEKIREKIEI